MPRRGRRRGPTPRCGGLSCVFSSRLGVGVGRMAQPKEADSKDNGQPTGRANCNRLRVGKGRSPVVAMGMPACGHLARRRKGASCCTESRWRSGCVGSWPPPAADARRQRARARPCRDAAGRPRPVDPAPSPIARTAVTAGRARRRGRGESTMPDEFDRAIEALASVPAAEPRRPARRRARTAARSRRSSARGRARRDGLEGGRDRAGGRSTRAGLPVGDAPASADTLAQAVAAVETETLDLPVELNEPVLVLHRPLPGPAARLVRGGALARAEYLPAHPRGLRRGGHPAGPRLRRPRRERLQDERLLAREGEGRLAVHQRDRQALRPASRLVGGRAQRPREGDARRRAAT